MCEMRQEAYVALTVWWNMGTPAQTNAGVLSVASGLSPPRGVPGLRASP